MPFGIVFRLNCATGTRYQLIVMDLSFPISNTKFQTFILRGICLFLFVVIILVFFFGVVFILVSFASSSFSSSQTSFSMSAFVVVDDVSWLLLFVPKFALLFFFLIS